MNGGTVTPLGLDFISVIIYLFFFVNSFGFNCCAEEKIRRGMQKKGVFPGIGG